MTTMTICTGTTATPSFPRALPLSVEAMPSWRDRAVVGTGVLGGSTGSVTRHASVTRSIDAAVHNSIATAAAAAGNAPVKDGFVAAKQAAPPRGIPR